MGRLKQVVIDLGKFFMYIQRCYDFCNALFLLIISYREKYLAEELLHSCLGFTHFTSWTDNSYLAVCKAKTNEDAICYIRGNDVEGHNLIIRYFLTCMNN